MVALLSVAVPPQALGAQEPAGDTVPVPGGGTTSDWDRVVGPAGDPEASAVAGPAVDSSSLPVAGVSTRLHVKLAEEASIGWDGRSFDDGADGSPLDLALATVPDLAIRPLFQRPAAALAADRAEAERISGTPQPDLTTWYLLTTEDPAAGARLQTLLRDLDVVEMVQPEPALAATAPAEEERQGYLNPDPSGVDAEWAWGRTGGTGSNVTVAVIDSGFDTGHPDLDRASASGVPIAHEPPWDTHHGLQVLGIIAADDDGAGLRGIASGSGLRTVNSGSTSGDAANAIDLAASALRSGDVITISQGICATSGCSNGVVLPLVYSSSARDAIRMAAARGVITVISAGNGGANLDTFRTRLGSDAPDAIVVGAGNPPSGWCRAGVQADGSPRSRVASSNYGSRVDLQGWGACVRTARQGGGYRWWGFTSAATPIVAGAAALVSSLAEQRLGIDLSGGQIRAILQTSGSAQVTAGNRGGRIGPLPDVRAAVAALRLIPGNDLWQQAAVIDEIPFSDHADARYAGVEVDEPAVLCGPISNSVWYTITPDDDVDLTFDTSGSDFDTVVALWRRQGGALAREGCSNDITVNNPRSRLSRVLEAGRTYFLQVGGIDGDSGELRLEVAQTGAETVGCDIDRDGRGDLVSGSPDEDVGTRRRAGRAVVHFGRAGTTPRRVTSVTQEWPGVTGSSERGDGFGAAVACGDFDGDGYDDIAIGGPSEDVGDRRNAGAVRVVPGGRDGLATSGALTLTQASSGIAGQAEAGDRFGAALAVGDFDGDGYDDLAIGVEGEDVGTIADAGLVQVVYGSRRGLGRRDQVFQGDTPGLPNSAEPDDELGATLAAGDLDGDGFDELVIGVPLENLRGAGNAGAVLVLRGAAPGLVVNGSVILHQDVEGVAGTVEPGDRFGRALAVGDIDGDGFDDIAVGVPGENIDQRRWAGMVHVFHGSVFGATANGSRILHQDTPGVRGRPEPGDRFGAAVAVGDLDGDGFDDLAVGAPGEAVGATAGAGLVQVFDGSAAGVDTAADQVITQASRGIVGRPEVGDHLGFALASVDLDGDGRRDLAVGVPDEDVGGEPDVGHILLLPGAGGGVDRSRSSIVSQRSPKTGANEPHDRFGHALAGS